MAIGHRYCYCPRCFHSRAGQCVRGKCDCCMVAGKRLHDSHRSLKCIVEMPNYDLSEVNVLRNELGSLFVTRHLGQGEKIAIWKLRKSLKSILSTPSIFPIEEQKFIREICP